MNRRTLLLGLLLLPLISTRTFAAPPEDQYFDSNGVRIRYIVQGEGEPLLLIHGFSANIQMQWGPRIIDPLSRQYKVVALDNRGHGKSGKPHDPAQYGNEMALDSIRLLDHLKIEKAHVMGYSMGGFITMKLLADHPHRLLSAVVGGSGWARPEDERVSIIRDLADSLEKGEGFGPLIKGLVPEGQPVPSDEQLKSMTAMMSAMNDVKALAAVARGMEGLFVPESALTANKIPVLGIVGGIDPLKRNLDAMTGKLAGLEVYVIEGADHMNAFTRPEYLAEVQRFLAARSGAPAKSAAPASASASVPAGQ